MTSLSPRRRKVTTIRLVFLILALIAAVALLYRFYIAVPAAPPPVVTRAALPLFSTAHI